MNNSIARAKEYNGVMATLQIICDKYKYNVADILNAETRGVSAPLMTVEDWRVRNHAILYIGEMEYGNIDKIYSRCGNVEMWECTSYDIEGNFLEMWEEQREDGIMSSRYGKYWYKD